MSEVMLSLESVTKAYNKCKPAEVQVLRGASLSVAKGEVVALVAPWAAGPWVERVAREKLAAVAKDRFASTVTVERVTISLLPPAATMTGMPVSAGSGSFSSPV